MYISSCGTGAIAGRMPPETAESHLRFRMKNRDVFEIVAQISPFVRAQHTHGQAEERPDVDHGIAAAVVLAELMDLGVAVVAAGNAVSRPGFLDLVVLEPAELQALLLEAGLEKSAPAAAAVVVGPVGLHIDKVFFAHNGFNHESQIFRNRIAVALAYDLAGILNRKFDLQVLVPVGIDLQPALADPFGIVFINVLDDKVVLDVELFQSCQD